ncbi:MAG TPA: phosphatase PAP2 family protein [bacterium]|nr:phosphatase PAP2 family protein [bacterium]
MAIRFLILSLILYSAYLLPRLDAAVAWDQAAIFSLAEARRPAWTSFFFFITKASDTRGFLVALILPALLFFQRRRWITGLWYLLGVGLLKLSISGLKVLLGRARPEGGLEILPTLSMPSGHAANAVFMFGLLAVFLWPRVGSAAGRILLWGFCLIGILLVDLSRVYLGVHYPSDVIVGSLYTAAGLWILQGFRKDVFSL